MSKPRPEVMRTIAAEMKAAMVERDREVDLLMAGLLSKTNVFFISTPGTAKSMLVDGLFARCDGATVFSCLLNQYTAPEDIFGPVSVTKLKSDQYVRLTDGYLPSATAGFVDEVFKGGPAIRDPLLGLLNERTFLNGGKRVKTPLRIVVTASNEWPTDENSAAFTDRLLIRATVKPVRSVAGLDRILDPNATFDPGSGTKFTVADLDAAQAAVDGVQWTDDARTKLREILDALASDGVDVKGATRRLRLSLKVAQAHAWMNGHAAVETEDLEILGATLWLEPGHETKAIGIVARIANPAANDARKLADEAAQLMESVNWGDESSLIETRKKMTIILNGDAVTNRQHLSAMDKKCPAVKVAAKYVEDCRLRISEALVKRMNAA